MVVRVVGVRTLWIHKGLSRSRTINRGPGAMVTLRDTWGWGVTPGMWDTGLLLEVPLQEPGTLTGSGGALRWSPRLPEPFQFPSL